MSTTPKNEAGKALRIACASAGVSEAQCMMLILKMAAHQEFNDLATHDVVKCAIAAINRYRAGGENPEQVLYRMLKDLVATSHPGKDQSPHAAEDVFNAECNKAGITSEEFVAMFHRVVMDYPIDDVPLNTLMVSSFIALRFGRESDSVEENTLRVELAMRNLLLAAVASAHERALRADFLNQ